MTRAEIIDVKMSWNNVIGNETGGHGISILLRRAAAPNLPRFFKLFPEVRVQYFSFLAGLTDSELMASPRLNQHASGLILGVTQIINGLSSPVSRFLGSHPPPAGGEGGGLQVRPVTLHQRGEGTAT